MRRRGAPVAGVLAAALAFAAPSVLAQQTGGVLMSGNAEIGALVNGLRTITQSSDRAVINWETFSVGAHETVKFSQPGTTSVMLNRVVGREASSILGGIQANGRVFLVNPNGVVFGAGSRVDVGALVASTLSISDKNFMAGNYVFEREGNPGSVENRGSITATGGGVALMGNTVRNAGDITARLGTVSMSAGDKITLSFGQNGLNHSVVVNQPTVDALVDSQGAIYAQGGQVLLTAHASNEVLRNVINHEGVIEARGLVERGGQIVLDGGSSGIVRVAGSLNVSSDKAAGGKVVVTGQKVLIDRTAKVDARGATGGGDISVGGGLRGEDATIHNADEVRVLRGSVLDASAVDNGDGGHIVLWSEKRTDFRGELIAKGGAQGGGGGSVETSSRGLLNFDGLVNVDAPKGQAGEVLLDPDVVEIVGGSGAPDDASLPDVFSPVGDTGVSRISEHAIESISSGTVTIEASGYVVVKDLTANGGDGSIDLQPDVSLMLHGKLAPGGSYFPAGAPGAGSSGGLYFVNAKNSIKAKGAGSVTLKGGSPNTSNPFSVLNNIGNISTERGSITLIGDDRVVVQGSLTTRGGSIFIDGDNDRGGGGSIELNGAVRTQGGSLALKSGFMYPGGTTILVANSVELGDGAISFASTKTTPSNYSNNYRITGRVQASGDVAVDRPMTFGNNSALTTNGAVRFAEAVTLDAKGTTTLTANGLSFAKTFNGQGGRVNVQQSDAAADVKLGASGAGVDFSSVLPQAQGFSHIKIGREDATGVTTVSGSNALNGALELVQGGRGGAVVFANDSRISDNGAKASSVLVKTGGDTRLATSAKIDVEKGVTILAGGTVDVAHQAGISTRGNVDVVADRFNYAATAAGIQAQRWRVYLPHWDNKSVPGLSADYRRYGCTYQVACSSGASLPDSGNGFIYSARPTLTVTPTGLSVVYGDADPKVAGATYSGFVDGDTQAGAGLSGSPKLGLESFTPSRGGYRQVGNYGTQFDTTSLASEQGYAFATGTNTLTVTPKTISAAPLQVQTRAYDGTTGAVATSSPLGALGGDLLAVTVSNAQFADKHAGGGKAVTSNVALTGDDARNYQLVSPTAQGVGTITRRLLDPSARFDSRVYDGTTGATGNINTLPAGAVVGGDNVSVVLGGSRFSDKNAGTGKRVTGDVTLAGSAAADYQLKQNTVSGLANITPKVIAPPEVVFSDRAFDGTRQAPAAPGKLAPGAVVGNDDLNVQLKNPQFNDPTPGKGKPAAAEVVLVGDDAINYQLTKTTITGKASITVETDPTIAVKAIQSAVVSEGFKWHPDAFSRLIAGGIKLPPDLAPLPVNRIER